MRRAWLRGRENIHKRYLVHVAGFNLGVLMRALHGQGTPREAADARVAFMFVLRTDALLVFGLIAVIDANPPRSSSPSASPQPRTENDTSSTGC